MKPQGVSIHGSHTRESVAVETRSENITTQQVIRFVRASCVFCVTSSSTSIRTCFLAEVAMTPQIILLRRNSPVLTMTIAADTAAAQKEKPCPSESTRNCVFMNERHRWVYVCRYFNHFPEPSVLSPDVLLPSAAAVAVDDGELMYLELQVGSVHECCCTGWWHKNCRTLFFHSRSLLLQASSLVPSLLFWSLFLPSSWGGERLLLLSERVKTTLYGFHCCGMWLAFFIACDTLVRAAFLLASQVFHSKCDCCR